MSDPITEETGRILRQMGLTEYETRIYLAALEIGATTARRLSEHANVPYSKIYEVLNSLEEKGWVQAQTGRPRRYYPKPPVEALEATKIRLENMMRDWEKSISAELQPLYDKMEIREKPEIWILRGEFNTIAKIREMIENVKTDLMIAIPALVEPVVNAVTPAFGKLIDSDVGLQVMLSKNVDRRLLDQISKVAEVKVRERMFGGGLIADGREAILVLGEEKPSLVIWSDHIGLVKFAKDYFNHLWNTADKISRT
ncbi:MAG: TrmB family transcriptional regulator [Candidatus Bathyarchaeota archaeon]|nr:TrmB family transcriptional regulator [Candidatus Bathyarchaeota archaeon]